MYPLNEAPRGIDALVRRFSRIDHVKCDVRNQMIAGGTAALAFAKVRNPDIDLSKVGRGLPEAIGGGRLDMEPYYAAATEPAENIVWLVEDETERILRMRNPRP